MTPEREPLIEALRDALGERARRFERRSERRVFVDVSRGRTHYGGRHVSIVSMANCHATQKPARARIAPLAQAVRQLHQHVWVVLTFQFQQGFADG